MKTLFASPSESISLRDPSGFSFYRLLPLLVFAVSLMVTYFLWHSAQRETERNLEKEFRYDAQETTSLIQHQMQMYEGLLRGVRGLFAASVSVDRHEFREYVTTLNLDRNFPGVQGVGFTQLVKPAEKAKFEAAVRREGFASFAIYPPGKRDLYSAVIYLEPFAGKNLRAFGHDIFADPVRRVAMERVRDTGLCTVSGKVRLMQEMDQDVQAGFMMWLPVYQSKKPHVTLAERRRNFKGWVGASFLADNLIASMFSDQPPRVQMELYDGDEMTPQALMHKSGRGFQEYRNFVPYFSTVSKLDINGRRWTVRYSSLPAFDQRLLDQKSRSVALSGVIISLLLALITGMLVRGHNRTVQAAQSLQRELAERKRAEAGMRLAEKVVENVDTAVLVTDTQTRIIKVNPGFTSITGYTAEEAIGRKTNLLASGAHPPEFYREMWASINNTGSWQGEISNRRKDGQFYTEWLSINEVRDDEGKLTNYVALFSDISERKAAEAHMVNLAHYDPLTGLPNRTLLADRLQQAIATARREKSFMAVLFVDLDNFKPINDSLGHHTGDIMLKEVATRMEDCLRESDTAARIGGDEFVVLLPVIEKEEDAFSVAEKIRHALDQPFGISGRQLRISSSIGVAVYPEHGKDENTLLRKADIAMYHAKDTGRNRVVRYEPSMEK